MLNLPFLLVVVQLCRMPSNVRYATGAPKETSDISTQTGPKLANDNPPPPFPTILNRHCYKPSVRLQRPVCFAGQLTSARIRNKKQNSLLVCEHVRVFSASKPQGPAAPSLQLPNATLSALHFHWNWQWRGLESAYDSAVSFPPLGNSVHISCKRTLPRSRYIAQLPANECSVSYAVTPNCARVRFKQTTILLQRSWHELYATH
jgi:hypothetical protein